MRMKKQYIIMKMKIIILDPLKIIKKMEKEKNIIKIIN